LAKSRKAGDRQATAIGADALKPNVEPSRRYWAKRSFLFRDAHPLTRTENSSGKDFDLSLHPAACISATKIMTPSPSSAVIREILVYRSRDHWAEWDQSHQFTRRV